MLEYPCIRTVPITPNGALREAIENISRYEWLCFTSPAGVKCFWQELEAMGLDSRALGGVKLAVIGSGTAKALGEHGIRADLMPEIYDAAHLGAALAVAAKGKILIARAEEGSPELTEALAHHDEISIYRTIYENPDPQALKELMDREEKLFVTFTSASTVRGFVNSLAGADTGRVVGLCIGRQTANEAKKHGIAVLIAQEATIDSLVSLAKENL